MCMRMVWRRGLSCFSGIAQRPRACGGICLAIVAGAFPVGANPAGAAERQQAAAVERFNMDAELQLAEGRRLFERVWQAKDERSRSGDGLGPVFNDRSCKACHHQGGTGGGGGNANNVQVITTSGSGVASTSNAKERRRVTQTHPGLVENTSVVLHRFGTTHGYEMWRAKRLRDAVVVDHAVPGADREFQASAAQLRAIDAIASSGPLNSLLLPGELPQSIGPQKNSESRSGWGGGSFGGPQARSSKRKPDKPTTRVEQRNSTALFGAGAIDAIPEGILEETAAWQKAHQPAQAGRAVRTADGKIGRFGWKSQQSNLNDFTLTACAVEVGLDVPGHSQGIGPDRMNYKAPGLDLDIVDCGALVAFIRALPAPVQQKSRAASDAVEQGHALFLRVGCADCHLENLGEAKGIYSDLLVHDMGEKLWGDSYGAFVAQPPKAAPAGPAAKADAVHIGEWRTPPLWGCADSAPYLHDGRAETLEEAIRAHGGQGARSAADFAAMPPVAQEKVIAFLKSLTVPPNQRIAKPRPAAGLAQKSKRKAP